MTLWQNPNNLNIKVKVDSQEAYERLNDRMKVKVWHILVRCIQMGKMHYVLQF